MDVATARLTVSAECLDLAHELQQQTGDALRVGERLRRAGHAPEVVAAAMTLADLRREAFPRLGPQVWDMVLTRAGMEQATRARVAMLHAQRFVRAGCRHIADLTSGLGLDARAFAAAGLGVEAFELDPGTAVLAAHNLAGYARVTAHEADALAGLSSLPPGRVDGVYADPARRTARGRRHDPDDYSPPLGGVLELRRAVPALGVKAGPSLPHPAIPVDMEADWVSVDGDVVEVGLWSGDAALGRGHAATVIRSGEVHRLAGDTHRGESGPLDAFILEPDGAVIRAGLVGLLGDELDAHLIDPTIAYLTSSTAPSTPFARAYRVLERLPLDTKVLARELRQREVGSVEIKKRGVDITPEQLRPRLKLKGRERATIILTRLEGHHAALLVDPVR